MYYQGKILMVGQNIKITDGKLNTVPVKDFLVSTIDDGAEVCILRLIRWPVFHVKVKKVYISNEEMITDSLLLMSNYMNRSKFSVNGVIVKKNKYTPNQMLIDSGFIETRKSMIKSRKIFDKEIAEEEKLDYTAVYANPYRLPWNLVPRSTKYLEIILKHTGPGDAVLDLGTGYGKNIGFLLNSGRDVYGIDISDIAIDTANRIFNLPDKLVAGSVLDLPYNNQKFSAVLDVGCLHCLKKAELDKALSEINRVLKHDGYLVSYFFLSMNKERLEKMPFKTESLGFSESIMISEVNKYFDVVEINNTPISVAFTAKKK